MERGGEWCVCRVENGGDSWSEGKSGLRLGWREVERGERGGKR